MKVSITEDLHANSAEIRISMVFAPLGVDDAFAFGLVIGAIYEHGGICTVTSGEGSIDIAAMTKKTKPTTVVSC